MKAFPLALPYFCRCQLVVLFISSSLCFVRKLASVNGDNNPTNILANASFLVTYAKMQCSLCFHLSIFVCTCLSICMCVCGCHICCSVVGSQSANQRCDPSQQHNYKLTTALLLFSGLYSPYYFRLTLLTVCSDSFGLLRRGFVLALSLALSLCRSALRVGCRRRLHICMCVYDCVLAVYGERWLRRRRTEGANVNKNESHDLLIGVHSRCLLS